MEVTSTSVVGPSPPRSSPDAGDAGGPLRLGSRGSQVEVLQERLNDVGESLPTNGQFGPRTLEAVRRFQVTRGVVPATGIVGPKTAQALAEASAAIRRGGWVAAPSTRVAAGGASEASARDASATRSADSQFVRGSDGWQLEKKRCVQGLSATETHALNAARGDPKQSKVLPGLTARIGKFISDKADAGQQWLSKQIDGVEKGSEILGPETHFKVSIGGGLIKGVTEAVTGTVGLVGKGLELTDKGYRDEVRAEAKEDFAQLKAHPGDTASAVGQQVWKAVKDNPGDVLGQVGSYLLPGAVAKLSKAGKVGELARAGGALAKEAEVGGKAVSAERLAETRAFAQDASLQTRYRAPPAGTRDEVIADLKKLPAQGARGATNAFDKFMESPLLGPEQKDRVLRAAAFAKSFTERTGRVAEPAGKAFQDSNRLHLEDELSVMTDVAKQLALSPRQAENAYLASVFSDVDKVPGRASLVTHHEAGARAAAVRLAEEFPNDPKRVAEIVELIKAHQISPPRFFAGVVTGEIKATLEVGGRKLSAVEEQALAGIKRKIADPLNPAHLNPSKTAIAFTEDEKKLLGAIGLKEWAVPSSREAWAVILADGKSNYGKPPHKIYGNRGPGTFFPDATSEEALASVLGPNGTAADAAAALPPELRASFEASVDEARAGVERARVKMDGWLKGQGRDPQNTVYWRNTPLKALDQGGTAADVETAKAVRTQFEQFLRQEAGL